MRANRSGKVDFQVLRQNPEDLFWRFTAYKKRSVGSSCLELSSLYLALGSNMPLGVKNNQENSRTLHRISVDFTTHILLLALTCLWAMALGVKN
jgi:hypothetical protein